MIKTGIIHAMSFRNTSTANKTVVNKGWVLYLLDASFLNFRRVNTSEYL